ncbi:MAG: hypothetical protein ACTSR3_01045 [Candidatus Helarchaeota archaeon]
MRIEIKGDALEQLLKIKKKIRGNYNELFLWILLKIKRVFALEREINHYKKQVQLQNKITYLMRKRMSELEAQIENTKKGGGRIIPPPPPPPPPKMRKPIKITQTNNIKYDLQNELNKLFRNGMVKPSEIKGMIKNG